MKRLRLGLFALLSCLSVQAQQHYTFEKGVVGPEWHYIGTPNASKYEVVDGRLRLEGDIHELSEPDRPYTFMGLPVTGENLVAETRLSLLDAENGDEAGLCVFRSRQCHVQCCLNNYQGSRRLKVRLQLLSHNLSLYDKSVGSLRDVWLRITMNEQKLRFYYSTDGKKFHWLEDVEQRLLAADLADTDAPLLVGMFALMKSTKYNTGYTYADFDYFDLQENQQP